MYAPSSLTSILTSLLTVGAVGGGGVAIYKFHPKISSWISPTSYLIVETEVVSSDEADEELIKKNSDNYFCSWKNTKDIGCKVVAEIDKSKYSKNTSNFSNIIDLKEPIKKENLLADKKYFVLSVSKEMAKSIDFNNLGSDKLEIIQGTNVEVKDKKFFAKAKPLALTINKKLTGDSSSFAAVVTGFSDPDLSEISKEKGESYKCLFGDIKNDFDKKSTMPCEIYDFSKDDEKGKTYSDLTFVGTGSTQESPKITKDKHYFVEFNSPNKFELSKLNKSINLIVTTDKESDKKYAVLKYLPVVVINKTSNSAKSNEHLIFFN